MSALLRTLGTVCTLQRLHRTTLAPHWACSAAIRACGDAFLARMALTTLRQRLAIFEDRIFDQIRRWLEGYGRGREHARQAIEQGQLLGLTDWREGCEEGTRFVVCAKCRTLRGTRRDRPCCGRCGTNLIRTLIVVGPHSEEVIGWCTGFMETMEARIRETRNPGFAWRDVK